MTENPLGYKDSLLPRFLVREAEVNTFPDTSIHNVLRRICETVIGPSLLDSRSIRGAHNECHSVSSEE